MQGTASRNDCSPKSSSAHGPVLRICIITSSFPSSPSDGRAAAGLFVQDFALSLAQLGNAVTVIAPDPHTAEKSPPPQIAVRWIPWAGSSKPLAGLRPYRPRDLRAMASLMGGGRRVLRELAEGAGIDHVMAMWAVPAGFFARGLKRRRGIPYSTWCLGSDIWVYGRYPIFRHIVSSILRESDLVFADGLALCQSASRLSGRDCSFLPSSRRLNRELASSFPWPDSGPKFLFIGRYAKVKGVDILLAAMKELLAAEPNATLMMFGGGPLESFVQQFVRENNLGEQIRVHGYAEERSVVSALKACDCLVIPSRNESIPVVLSDAMQMGRPVIVTDVGDMVRLLREHPAGLVVPPEDPQALCRAMREMAASDTARFAPHVEALAGKFDIREAACRWIRAVEALSGD